VAHGTAIDFHRLSYNIIKLAENEVGGRPNEAGRQHGKERSCRQLHRAFAERLLSDSETPAHKGIYLPAEEIPSNFFESLAELNKQ
jgi:hypothetical protein